ncbi:hypothetical protein WR25_22779 [Diploscapter pachys]|uniref:G-protein alpha subunit n=1 Tax=Diploscapter pachys TaxID=2018661 RepID=A0A2A2JJD5_9BILA|nr:hypothetical protein WR25_22779 [Diploscapter pachys]
MGAAESGKTTLLEQIRLLYNQNWTEAEMFHSKAFIYNNILQNIRILIEGVKKSGEKLTNPENEPRAESLLNNDESRYARFPESMANDIKSIWNDPSIQEIYAKRSTMNLNDSAKYFLDNLDNINKEDYVPSPKDLIMSYVPTVGVQNVIFTCNNRAFQLFDIGGQKIDRRKWATMYDGIDAIFFCLAISEYNQTMYEDPNMNRLIDSLSLLQKISDEPKFKETPIFLFLNEVDVFKEKLNIFPLENYCLNYSGKSEEDALNYMESLAKQATIGRSMGLIYIYRMFFKIALALLLTSSVFSTNPKFTYFVDKLKGRIGDAAMNCSDDQYAAAHKCFDAYYANWNAVPFTFEQFEKQYDHLMDSKGVQGFEQACTYQDTLTKCLIAANVNMDNCVTNEAFEDWYKINVTEAEQFRTTYFIFDYECNAGKPIVTQNFVCLRDIKRRDKKDMDICQTQYNNALNSGTPFCKAYNDYVTCVENVYTHYCGKQVVPWICNVEEIGLKVNYDGCNNQLQNCNQ